MISRRTLPVIVLLAAAVTLLQPTLSVPQQDSNNNSSNDYANLDAEATATNRIVQIGFDGDQNTIKLAEPYKSLVQTSARFAIAQSGITRHMDMDTAMQMLNDAGYMLSKPANLIKVAAGAVITMTLFLMTCFFSPEVLKSFERAAWTDPSKVYTEYYTSIPFGAPRSWEYLDSQLVRELPNLSGLADHSCRLLTVCRSSQLLREFAPQATQAPAEFLAKYLSKSSYRENKIFDAFISGYVEVNCKPLKKKVAESGKRCIGDIL